jgi:hypothetical protein
MLGKIKRIPADLSENILNSVYFITTLHTYLGKASAEASGMKRRGVIIVALLLFIVDILKLLEMLMTFLGIHSSLFHCFICFIPCFARQCSLLDWYVFKFSSVVKLYTCM